jgi:6-pyruvoyltetrahydropterin/6-carboxytetrahydropterin synthase
VYYLTIKTDFSAAHFLRGYQGKCARLHGHNYGVEVTVRGAELDGVGMLVDFVELKGRVNELMEELDHTNLNEHKAFQALNTSAEHIARYLFERLEGELPEGVALQAIKVHETERASAMFMREPEDGAVRLFDT